MTLVENNMGNLVYYQFKEFIDFEHVFSHLFSSRIGWDIDKIRMKEQICNIIGVPTKNIISVKQVHGTNIIIIDSNIKDYESISQSEADGLITNLPNVALITYHADCVPVYFIDISKKVIGLAHSGWKGTFNNITGKMIKTMRDRYNSNSEDIFIAIGPSIGPCCYEVKDDLIQLFTEKYGNFDFLFRVDNDKAYLDLWKTIYLQILEEGIPKENIILSNTCTSCNIDKFYSYRREKGTNNRMVAVISLR